MKIVFSLLIILLSFNLSTSRSASNFFGGKYLGYTVNPTAKATLLADQASINASTDYHEINFFESTTSGDITSSLGEVDGSYIYYRRDDDSTYPSSNSFGESSTQGTASVYSFYKNFLLEAGWTHPSMNYVAWDITSYLCSPPAPYAYKMKIKFFSCETDADNFYANYSFSTSIKILYRKDNAVVSFIYKI